jgi:hypothetical protein
VPKLPLEKAKAKNALAAITSMIIPEIKRMTGRAAMPLKENVFDDFSIA